MTFQKGQSGNPAGRPPGARGKASIFAEGLFQGAAEDIIGIAIEKAKEGDMTAVRLCLDRIVPRSRERGIAFALPPLDNAASAVTALANIAAAVAPHRLQRLSRALSGSPEAQAHRRRCGRPARGRRFLDERKRFVGSNLGVGAGTVVRVLDAP